MWFKSTVNTAYIVFTSNIEKQILIRPVLSIILKETLRSWSSFPVTAYSNLLLQSCFRLCQNIDQNVIAETHVQNLDSKGNIFYHFFTFKLNVLIDKINREYFGRSFSEATDSRFHQCVVCRLLQFEILPRQYPFWTQPKYSRLSSCIQRQGPYFAHFLLWQICLSGHSLATQQIFRESWSNTNSRFVIKIP